MSQEAKVAGRMRQDWDQRARRDAFHYIASWRKDWDPQSFFASGEEDYQGLVAPVLSELSFDPAGKAMLELGCGAGRMTRSFARRFGRVFAFDVSAEMLGRAQALLDGAPNVIWVQGNGLDLSTVASRSVEFVFSYLVLQHLPEETLALRYIGEMLRVLRDGGVFLFQFNGSRAATMNWKGRLSWSLVDACWSLGLTGASRRTAALLGLDPNVAGKSWRGAALDAGKVCQAVGAAGGSARGMNGENTPMSWCWGMKQGA